MLDGANRETKAGAIYYKSTNQLMQHNIECYAVCYDP